MKITVIRLSHAGDMAHAIPFIRALKSSIDCKIVWVIEEKFFPVVKYESSVDRFFILKGKKGLRRFIFSRGLKSDIVIDLQGLLKSGIIAYKIIAEEKIGFADARECAWIFYTRKISPPARIHVIDRNLFILKSYFNIKPEKISTELITGVREDKEAKILIAQAPDRINVFFNPVAGWKNKSIPLDVCIKIINYFKNNKKFNLWINATGENIKIFSEFATGNIFIFKNLPLNLLIAIIKRMNLAIGPDTGPIHFASMCNIPTIGIYGPTDPARNGPYGKNSVIIYKNLTCSPCWRRNCNEPECMNISLEDIIEGMKKLGF